MIREERYLVLKHLDIDAALNDSELTALYRISTKILKHRQDKGKQPLNVVVVEHDWPEFEATWQAIEKRMDAEMPNTTVVLRNPASCEAVQHSDQMLCHHCQIGWDVNDSAPPLCGKQAEG